MRCHILTAFTAPVRVRRLALFLALFLAGAPLWAEGGVVFSDLAAEEGSGLHFARVPSLSDAISEEFRAGGVLTPFDLGALPIKGHGAPGIAVLDFDNDGDFDLYVPNGPGGANSLFANQLAETGEVKFEDVAVAAGVAATDQDSSGVCFGDTDNDGDEDLFVLSNFDPRRFFVNNGDGTFSDHSVASGLAGEVKSSVSCSFGDVDGDGLLDVVVANLVTDMSAAASLVSEPYAFNQHNQLFRNTGGNVFVDVSESSGILDLEGPPGFAGSPTPTWAIAMVDMDLDGDVDIVHADDQAGIPTDVFGGLNRGTFHLLENDGSGHFTDVTASRGLDHPGSWMGLSFGDLNHDGRLDLFGTNAGDWDVTTLTPLDPVYSNFGVYALGDMATRWYLARPDGSFVDPGRGSLVATPFGWGTSMADYDNDGDTDIIFDGGFEHGPSINLDMPEVILSNDGSGRFTWDEAAIAGMTGHARRVVHGLAVGDLDDNGFVDIVTISNFNVPASSPLSTYATEWGSPFDGHVKYCRIFEPSETPGIWTFAHVDFAPGTVAVDLNSGGNGNRWVKVEVQGSVGLVDGAEVNRDGFGAVVRFRPASGGKPVTIPVIGGSSYASQDSRELVFGLGDTARRGWVEVFWPGGTRNRLYQVRGGETVKFPEIPCSYTANWSGGLFEYASCVDGALDDLGTAGVLDAQGQLRFFISALLAYLEN